MNKFRSLILAHVFMLAAAPAWAGILPVQSAQANVTSSSISVAFPSNNAAGNLLVVGVEANYSSGPTITVTDTLNGSYTSAIAPTSWYNGVYQAVQIFYFPNCAGGANTVTATASNGSWINVVAAEYSGAATSAVLDGAGASATGSSASASTGSFAVTANDLIVGMALMQGSTAAGSGFVSRGTDGYSLLEDQIAGTASANATWTGNSGAWGAVAVAFLPAVSFTPTYSVTLSESNSTSDTIARQGVFGRSPNPVTWTHAYSYAGWISPSPGTFTLGFTPPGGSLLLVAAWGCSNLDESMVLTDNSSGPADSWTTTLSDTDNTGGYLNAWATVVTGGAAPTTITITNPNYAPCYIFMVVDDYTGGPSSVVVDGSPVMATGSSAYPTATFVTGSAPGDLLWSGVDATGASATVASPFTLREDALWYMATADDGVPGGVAANTSYTAAYTLSTSTGWGCFIVAFRSSTSESNSTSDAVARLAAFGRGDTESNPTSDAIARSGVFGRGDTESNPTSDAVARSGIFGRGDTESNPTSDAVARNAAFGRGDSEVLTPSDALARRASFGRSDSEALSVSDSLVRSAAFVRDDTESSTTSDSPARFASFRRSDNESNTASDLLTSSAGRFASPTETLSTSDSLTRLANLGREDSEINTVSDLIARVAGFGRGDNESSIASDTLARAAAYGRGDSESNPTSDSLGRLGWYGRAVNEAYSVSDAIAFLPVFARHRLAVPGQVKTGSEAGRVKSGTAPVH
jgi:hypothetical protein